MSDSDGFRGRQPRKPRKKQHISNIAHHFLESVGEGDGKSDGLQTIAICGAGHGHLIGWVCAGIARGSGGVSLVLEESPQVAWSATSYLTEDELVPLAGHEFPENQGQLACWSVRPRTGQQPRHHDEGKPRRLLNLGSLNNYQLGRLEAVVQLGSLRPRLPGQGGAVVWCLTPDEAVSLSAAYTLGRALALLEPRALEILVVDLACLNTPAHQQLSAGPGVLERCRETMRAVTSCCMPRFHAVVPASVGSEEPREQLARIGRLLLAGDDSD